MGLLKAGNNSKYMFKSYNFFKWQFVSYGVNMDLKDVLKQIIENKNAIMRHFKNDTILRRLSINLFNGTHTSSKTIPIIGR
jgi:hypothetical protein